MWLEYFYSHTYKFSLKAPEFTLMFSFFSLYAPCGINDKMFRQKYKILWRIYLLLTTIALSHLDSKQRKKQIALKGSWALLIRNQSQLVFFVDKKRYWYKLQQVFFSPKIFSWSLRMLVVIWYQLHVWFSKKLRNFSQASCHQLHLNIHLVDIMNECDFFWIWCLS